MLAMAIQAGSGFFVLGSTRVHRIRYQSLRLINAARLGKSASQSLQPEHDKKAQMLSRLVDQLLRTFTGGMQRYDSLEAVRELPGRWRSSGPEQSQAN